MAVFLSWESIHPFFGFFARKGRQRIRHVALNLVMGAINSLAVALVFVALWLWAAEWAFANDFGLLNQLSISTPIPGWLRALFAVLILDAWTYCWHRLNHRIPFLWRFHKVHHSDPNMDVTTATRFHIGEIILSSLLRIPLILVFGIYVWELVLYETIMFAVVQFHHANIGLPAALDRFLRMFIVTPNMHKVHHSKIRIETDSNYSSLLSIWDRIGRSFRLRANPQEIEFGLEGIDQAAADSLPSLLKMPATPDQDDN